MVRVCGILSIFNEFSQPVGEPVPAWQGCLKPQRVRLVGRYCRIEPLDSIEHAFDLLSAFSRAPASTWTYLGVGPFSDPQEHLDLLAQQEKSQDPLHFSIIDLSLNQAVGTCALMRQDSGNGVIEIGWLTYSPLLQRSRVATEAQFLLMRYVFEELGYRRYEWKCDSLNEPSRAAAYRLGFTYEGRFRKALVYKGRNRDTDWFSLIDDEWQEQKKIFESWLMPNNFDSSGQQIRSLGRRKQVGS